MCVRKKKRERCFFFDKYIDALRTFNLSIIRFPSRDFSRESTRLKRRLQKHCHVIDVIAIARCHAQRYISFGTFSRLSRRRVTLVTYLPFLFVLSPVWETGPYSASLLSDRQQIGAQRRYYAPRKNRARSFLTRSLFNLESRFVESHSNFDSIPKVSSRVRRSYTLQVLTHTE